MKMRYLLGLCAVAAALAGCGGDVVAEKDYAVDGGGPACGEVVCDEGQVCCNASCGICTAPGESCTQQACN